MHMRKPLAVLKLRLHLPKPKLLIPRVPVAASAASLLATQAPSHVLFEQWLVVNPGPETQLKGIIQQCFCHPLAIPSPASILFPYILSTLLFPWKEKTETT